MAPATKIVTCCYCGTRAALVLRGDMRHELSCASCGAPLHEMKNLPRGATNERPRGPHRPAYVPDRSQRPQPKRPKRRKRKSLSRKLLSEAFDLIEDILD